MNKKLCVAALGLIALSAQAAERPNIVFILTDDQAFDRLGYEGVPVQTPNIDKLAKMGTYFTNARVSSPTSMPSRTTILTGRYERSHGVNFNSATMLSDEAWFETYPMVLKQSGYYTGYIGKNHTPAGAKGNLSESTYDYWYGLQNHLKFYLKERSPIFKGAKNDTQPEILEEGIMDFLSPEERTLMGTKSFLNSRPKDQPFFINLCFNLPHAMGTENMELRPTDPEIYRTLYRDQEIPIPKEYVAQAEIETPKLPHNVHRPENMQDDYDYCDTPELLKERIIREYQAMTGIDRVVGHVMDELKRQKLDKNTIIIFSSDHGKFMGEYGLRGKGMCYEICTKVPFIIYDPTVSKLNKKENNELIMSVDIAPTVLDYAGARIPDTYSGHSLKPLLQKKVDKVRDYAFTENLWSTPFGNPRCESVQDKEWKYIRYYEQRSLPANNMEKTFNQFGLSTGYFYSHSIAELCEYRSFIEGPLNGEKPIYEELYNIKDDPREANNLIDKKKYSNIVEKLRTQCDIELKLARGKVEKPRVIIKAADYKGELENSSPAKKK